MIRFTFGLLLLGIAIDQIQQGNLLVAAVLIPVSALSVAFA